MSRSDPVSPEVLAVAVALAVTWPEGEATEAESAAESSPWRWGGRRWERPASYRWS